MSRLHFLGGTVPLTKTLSKEEDGSIKTTSYPNLKHFTSYEEFAPTLKEFYTLLTKHSETGHCLLKGELTKPLYKDSRAGCTTSDTPTTWICLDLDSPPFNTVEDCIAIIPELKDVSHIIQYSASYGITNKSLRAHIFFLLEEALPPAIIKAWLMDVNLRPGEIRKGITLSNAKAALHWPIDITACQNDKLIYITPPVLKGALTSTLNNKERIIYVPRKKLKLPVNEIRKHRNLAALQQETRQLINSLREEQGIPKLNRRILLEGNYEIQPNPGQATVTGIKQERGFTYLNLNGGDSWGYYHPEDNYELLFNFKGEPTYRIRELLPEYYNSNAKNSIPKEKSPEEVEIIRFGFRDMKTANYHMVEYNKVTDNMDIWPAKTTKQINDWLTQHGLPEDEFTISMHMGLWPTENFKVDFENFRINTYTTPDLLKNPQPSSLEDFPTINKVIHHLCQNDETYDHFINWLACIFQYRCKTGSAWVMQGTEGTGKSTLTDKIIAPILGRNRVAVRMANELKAEFTSWLEPLFIANINEVSINVMRHDEKYDVINKLKLYITDETVPYRPMYASSYNGPSYVNFIFTANSRNALNVTAQDRRYNITPYQEERIKLTQKEVEILLPQELKSFAHYMMLYKANRQQARTILNNDAHADIVERNTTNTEMVTECLKRGDLETLTDSANFDTNYVGLTSLEEEVAAKYADIMRQEILNNEWVPIKTNPNKFKASAHLLANGELDVIYMHNVDTFSKKNRWKNFGSYMRRQGFETKTIRKNNGIFRGIEIEWIVNEDFLIRMRENFDNKGASLIPLLKIVKPRRSKM